MTLGFVDSEPTKAIVSVSVDSITDSVKVSSQITKLDGARSVYEITGQYDIIAIMESSNIAGINSDIDKLRKISGVTDTNTVIILRTLK